MMVTHCKRGVVWFATVVSDRTTVEWLRRRKGFDIAFVGPPAWLLPVGVGVLGGDAVAFYLLKHISIVPSLITLDVVDFWTGWWF